MIYGVQDGRGEVSFWEAMTGCLPGNATMFANRRENLSNSTTACTNVQVLGYKSVNVNSVKHTIRE